MLKLRWRAERAWTMLIFVSGSIASVRRLQAAIRTMSWGWGESWGISGGFSNILLSLSFYSPSTTFQKKKSSQKSWFQPVKRMLVADLNREKFFSLCHTQAPLHALMPQDFRGYGLCPFCFLYCSISLCISLYNLYCNATPDTRPSFS